MPNLFSALNAEMAGLVSAVQQSVVEIRDDHRQSIGAGTIWHEAGLIVTNAHVARHGAANITLGDGRTLRAQVIARDDERDLAALAVDPEQSSPLPTIQVARGGMPQPGQWVFAVGHPWGVHNAATGGVIIGRSPALPDMPRIRNDWIVADLHLRPGNSGGPMVNTRGQLVGVNTMITGPSVGIAVSVEAVKDFLQQTIGRAAMPSAVTV